MTCYGELGISLSDVHRITRLPIVREVYNEFLPPNKLIMEQQLPDSLRYLFRIWGHLHTGKLQPKLGGWEAFVLDHPGFLSRSVQVVLLL